MEQKLWAMLIPGPDDVWAMPSKEAAEEYAAKHNKAIETGLLAELFCLPKESVQARVIEWQYSAEEHAEALRVATEQREPLAESSDNATAGDCGHYRCHGSCRYRAGITEGAKP